MRSVIGRPWYWKANARVVPPYLHLTGAVPGATAYGVNSVLISVIAQP